MKLRKERTGSPAQRTPNKDTPKKRSCTFAVNQSISNRRLSTFTTFSKQSKEEMTGIMSSINSICNSMFFGSPSNQDGAISSNAKTQTRRLSITLGKLKEMNDAFNQEGFLNYEGPKRSNFKKKATIKEAESPLSLSEISTVYFKTDENEREEEDIAKRFKQMNQLRKLKGEIRLMDQKKKYSLKKTFEKTKVYFKQHFARKEKDNVKYKPYLQYNKEDLYYNRTYNTVNTVSHHLSSATNQNIQTESIGTEGSEHQKAQSNRLFTPYDPKKSKFSFFTTGNSYYKANNNLLSLTTGTNTSKGNDNNINRPITAPMKRKAEEKNKKRFLLIKRINNKAQHESDKLNREMALFQSKEKPKKKKLQEESLSISDIRKEFRLDLLGRNIDENKIMWDNAHKVMRNLDKQSQILLCQIVREMIYTDDLLNRKYYDESSYTKKLESITEKKEFQKVVDKMMALKKKLKADKAIVPVNEKEKLFKMVGEQEDKEWKNITSLRDLKQKVHIMASIKPLLNYNKVIIKQKKIKIIAANKGKDIAVVVKSSLVP